MPGALCLLRTGHTAWRPRSSILPVRWHFGDLEARQVAFSYAYAFADKTFSVGVTGKIIQGAAYNKTTNLQGGQDPESARTISERRRSLPSYGIDVGAMYRPSSWLRFGVVAKDINQPTFDAPDGSQFKLTPQVRGGVARESLVDR